MLIFHSVRFEQWFGILHVRWIQAFQGDTDTHVIISVPFHLMFHIINLAGILWQNWPLLNLPANFRSMVTYRWNQSIFKSNSLLAWQWYSERSQSPSSSALSYFALLQWADSCWWMRGHVYQCVFLGIGSKELNPTHSLHMIPETIRRFLWIGVSDFTPIGNGIVDFGPMYAEITGDEAKIHQMPSCWKQIMILWSIKCLAWNLEVARQ